jgi:hypothetical protein
MVDVFHLVTARISTFLPTAAANLAPSIPRFNQSPHPTKF